MNFVCQNNSALYCEYLLSTHGDFVVAVLCFEMQFITDSKRTHEIGHFSIGMTCAHAVKAFWKSTVQMLCFHVLFICAEKWTRNYGFSVMKKTWNPSAPLSHKHDQRLQHEGLLLELCFNTPPPTTTYQNYLCVTIRGNTVILQALTGYFNF